jgi:signal peptidase I
MSFHIEDDGYWHRHSDMHHLPRTEDNDVLSVHENYMGGKSVLREVAETIILTLLIFFVVRAVVQNFKVEGDSMMPTLHTEQYILVNKALYFRYDANFIERLFNKNVPPKMQYLFHGPQRGDIVVFQAPREPKDFIKRVIAVEGETIQVKPDLDPNGPPGHECGGCGVYVNGVKLDEPYIKDNPDYTVESTRVPEGYVYVLGDNRNNSSDSHIWQALSIDSIIGTAFVSYWGPGNPEKYIGFLPHPSYAEIEKQP